MEKDPSWKYLRPPADITVSDGKKKYHSKRSCWIPDPSEGFVGARIRSSKGDQAIVVTDNGIEKTVKKEELQEMNPPKFEKAEDMANLTFLNDASVLHNLRQRYYSMLIYTYSGLFCVVINPYKNLPIYTENVIRMYMGRRRSEMPPHLFAISDEAYRNMMQDKENQSILITGESGAGKTENTKRVISYFATVGATQSARTKAGKKATLEEQIVKTNPVLEAFGNAKTVRNNNSSRFGKFIRIYFNGHGKLAGDLLEKSRVIKQAPGERCFHIFYQLMSCRIPGLKGATAIASAFVVDNSVVFSYAEKLFLNKEIRHYKLISQAEVTIDGMDDGEEMQITDEAFDVMNFEQEEKDNLYKLCAAIMHMGEMKFKQRPREEQAESDGTDEADMSCRLMAIDTADFLKALLKPRVKVGAEWVNKSQNLDQVSWSVGALCKAIYARTFKWLITRCNRTLDVADADRKFFIGVLDIAGFEIFDFNSFEQLWINFVNEKLQQFFNHHMFVLEQELYKSEGIAWNFIDFGLDLQACIELIEKPLGIVSVLDEECIVPRASDQTFVQKLNDQHLGKHPNFQKARSPKGTQSEAHFAIVHYAGTVRYNASGWLEKNKDPLNDSVVSVLKSSADNRLIVDIWADYETQEESSKKKVDPVKKKGKAASFLTVSMMYRESLNTLMNMLRSTHPHFIRCIVPNESKKSGLIEAGLVLNQLTCNGVLEGIRICRKGFPNRFSFDEFAQRYSILKAEEAGKLKSSKEKTKAILQSLVTDGAITEDDFQIGITKVRTFAARYYPCDLDWKSYTELKAPVWVFFKAGIMACLEDMHNEAMSAMLLGVQTAMRAYLAKAEYYRKKKEIDASIILQRNVKRWLELRHWHWFSLYARIKPLLSQAKQDELVEQMTLKIKVHLESDSFDNFEEAVASSEQLCKNLESQVLSLNEQKRRMEAELAGDKSSIEDLERTIQRLSESKKDLQEQNEDLQDQVHQAHKQNTSLEKCRKGLQEENDLLKDHAEEVQTRLKAVQAEKSTLEQTVHTLKETIARQEKNELQLSREKKLLEENSSALQQDIKLAEEKLTSTVRQKANLERTLDQVEQNLELERRARQDADKARRKLEGDLKISKENSDEINQIRLDLEANVRRKEEEISTMARSLAEEEDAKLKLQKALKEMQVQIDQLADEVSQERENRLRAERRRQELQNELEEIAQQADEAAGATQAQVELNKKRELEIAKLKREHEEALMSSESRQSSLQKRHAEIVADLNEQIDTLQKLKQRLEKEKTMLQNEIDELRSMEENERMAKAYQEKQLKQAEFRAAEALQGRDEYAQQVQDLEAQRQRLVAENTSLNEELANMQSQVTSMTQAKQRMVVQLEEARKTAEEKTAKCDQMIAEYKRSEKDLAQVSNQLEQELDLRSDLQRQLAKAKAEIQSIRTTFEHELLKKTEELDDAKKTLLLRTNAMQVELEKDSAKISSLEKVRNRLQLELDSCHEELDKVNALNSALERKQRMYEKATEEWKQKCDEITTDLETSQRENRAFSTEVFKLRAMVEQAVDKEEAARRECKVLTDELQDLTAQLGVGGQTFFEIQKNKRLLELEKEELQTALEEAESALELEESKTLKSQAELTQIRQEIEQQLREKEEEFAETRRSHSRAIDSLKATLESESKGKQELSKTKKKLESDISELELALDHAHKSNADFTKQLKRYQEQIRQLQNQVDEEQRNRNELRERCDFLEKRFQTLLAEKEEMTTTVENQERLRRLNDQEVNQLKEQLDEVQLLLNSTTVAKRKMETEIQALRGDLEDMTQEAKDNEEKYRKATLDATRLSDELRQEQEHSQYLEQKNKSLEQQTRDLQTLFEETEVNSVRGKAKYINQLEQKLRDLEMELDSARRKQQDSDRVRRKNDRQLKELEAQIEEARKNDERMHELIDRLNSKVRAYKRQAEEAVGKAAVAGWPNKEQIAAMNLSKYRHSQNQLQEAEERADLAENSLAKFRAKSRSSSYKNLSNMKTMMTLSTSSRDLSKSQSALQKDDDESTSSL
ncbi:myosin tail family protein [Trichuris trichiura]|uniref:Myosin tail family protein n=1 Tax=Trichuris trichiura TaxID=36087 RepID=A0A077Z422_TRITR|nr:myosin tail family protein [Trichuris trichiura]